MWACRQLPKEFSNKKLHYLNHRGATLFISWCHARWCFLNCSISSSCQICVTELWLLFDVCSICSNRHCCFVGINNTVWVISHFIKELCHFSWSFQRTILMFQGFFSFRFCFKFYWFSAPLISGLLVSPFRLFWCFPSHIFFFFFSFPEHLHHWCGNFLLSNAGVECCTFFLSYCFSYDPTIFMCCAFIFVQLNTCFKFCWALLLES